MKARILFLLPVICLPGLAVPAQNTNPPAPSLAITSFATQGPALHLAYSAALPVDPRFAFPPDSPGESSSRKHSGNANRNGPAVTTDPAVVAQDASDAPCDQPAKLFSAHDYSGPLSRFTAWFSRKPEMTTVPTRRTNGHGQRICGLTVGQKFHLFRTTTIDPVTFIGAGVSAGASQYNNDDADFGQGAEGYGKRYAAAFADRASWNFFGKFFYPAIFKQDPRYYRQGHGSVGGRLGHAMAHTFVAQSDAGNRVPNWSLWASTASTVALSNLYHPGNDRGFGPAATRAGIGIATSMGFDVAKEFWPEIVRKLHLPFKERRVAPVGTIAKP